MRPSANRPGLLYLLKCRDYLKVGFTSHSFETRLLAIRAAIPFQVIVLATRAGTLEEERLFHQENKEYLHTFGGREWYNDTPYFRKQCNRFFGIKEE